MGVFEGFSMWIGKMMADIIFPVAIILFIIILYFFIGYTCLIVQRLKKTFGKVERGEGGKETEGNEGGGTGSGETEGTKKV